MKTPTDSLVSPWLNEGPAVTLSFWIVKIVSSTVGEAWADHPAVNASFGQGAESDVPGALNALQWKA